MISKNNVNGEQLSHYFEKYGMSSAKAMQLGKVIVQSDPNCCQNTLKQLFDDYDNKKDFCAEILEDALGIKSKLDQSLIVMVLKKCPPLPEGMNYLLGYFGGENLHHIENEKKMIQQNLARSNLKMTSEEMGPIGILEKTDLDQYKVLHLALHGGVVPTTSDKIPTLAFRYESGVQYVSASLLCKVLASCCAKEKQEGNKEENSISCVVLNACASYQLAEMLKQEGVPYVVSWKTKVDDEVAKTFSESFYHHLGSDRSNIYHFKEAYDKALLHLKLRQWALCDPMDEEALVKCQEEAKDIELKAAGTPCLHKPCSSSSHNDQLRSTEHDTETLKKKGTQMIFTKRNNVVVNSDFLLWFSQRYIFF